jgi:hypothetical protein
MCILSCAFAHALGAELDLLDVADGRLMLLLLLPGAA